MELCNLDTGLRKSQIIIIQDPMGNLTEEDMRKYLNSSKEEI